MTPQFLDFTSHVISQKEVSIIIAEGAGEIPLYVTSLLHAGFIESQSYKDLLMKSKAGDKTFFVLQKDLPKEIYDFIVQYATGRIQIFDTSMSQSIVVTPTYKESACVFLATEETLKAIEAQGYDVLSHIGLAYRKELN